MNILGKTIRTLSHFPFAYKISRKIVDYHQNENNCDILTNGEMHFLKSNIYKFKVVFDVGANVGEWTEQVTNLSREYSKKTQDSIVEIYSFEPSKQTFKTLEKNVGNFKNVSIHNIGLGEKREEKLFFIYGEDSTLNSVLDRSSNGLQKQETENVSLDTLDLFCNDKKIDHIDFLKIDTEGNELNVLKGATRMIREAKIIAIQIEYGGTYIQGRNLLKDVFEIFKGTQYSLYKMYAHNIRKVEYSEQLENFQYANYIAFRNNL